MKLPITKTDIQIRFIDLDPLGHISNSIYTQYFDMGRVDFFKKIMELGESPTNVVVSIHIDMIKEILFTDKIYVETWCSKIGNKSMHLEQHIFSNELCVTKATVVVVAFDQKNRKSISLPKNWEPSAH